MPSVLRYPCWMKLKTYLRCNGRCAHVIDDKSERMYCAGDDDQAIYEWAGADVEHFINLPGGSEVLEQSYRIPGEHPLVG